MFYRYEPTLRKKTTPQSETQLGLSQPRHQVLGMAFNRIQRALLHCHCRSLDFPQSPPWLNPEHHRVRAGHGIPRASLLLTIGTSKGQLKWIWFQQGSKRQLYNLQSFDDASRGPLDSLKILFQRPQQGRLLLSLAAVVTLLALFGL